MSPAWGSDHRRPVDSHRLAWGAGGADRFLSSLDALPQGPAPRAAPAPRPLQLTSAQLGHLSPVAVSPSTSGPQGRGILRGHVSSRRCEKALGFITDLQAAAAAAWLQPLPRVPSATRPWSEGLSCCPSPPGGPSVYHLSHRIQSLGALGLAFSSAVLLSGPAGEDGRRGCCVQVPSAGGWLVAASAPHCPLRCSPRPLAPPTTAEQAEGHRTAQGPCWLLRDSLDSQDGAPVPAFFLPPSGLLAQPPAPATPRPGPHVGLPAASALSECVKVHPIA